MQCPKCSTDRQFVWVIRLDIHSAAEFDVQECEKCGYAADVRPHTPSATPRIPKSRWLK